MRFEVNWSLDIGWLDKLHDYVWEEDSDDE